MSFLLACPLCGPRDVYEFRFGGEVQQRPAPGSSQADWGEYLYARTNVSGVERAWWFHRGGCRRWFQAERDTRDNRVLATGWTLAAVGAGGRTGGGPGGAAAVSGPVGAAAVTGTEAPASEGAPEMDAASG